MHFDCNWSNWRQKSNSAIVNYPNDTKRFLCQTIYPLISDFQIPKSEGRKSDEDSDQSPRDSGIQPDDPETFEAEGKKMLFSGLV